MSKNIKSKAIIYYSLEGNIDYISKTIGQKIDADIYKIKLENPLNSDRFSKYLIGGFQSMFNIKPNIINAEIDLSSYDVIFIGTPVWAGRHAPAINTFLSSKKIKDKDIVLFCSYKGDKGKVFEKLEENLYGNNIISKMEFKEPIKEEETDTKITEWINELSIK